MTQYRSDPRRHTDAQCQTIAQVRYEIDRLDRLLVSLIKERQDYMDAAARLKSDRDAVHDDARIEDVIAKVLHSARKAGLDTAIAEPVWRTMIARCIAYEFARWDGLRKDSRRAL